LELDYIATVLEEDAKNYHAWSHRQFILKETLAHWDSNETDENNIKEDIVLLWKEELEYGKRGRHTNEGTLTLSQTDRLTTFPAWCCLLLLFSHTIQSIN
jgi:GH43 family beta-xylosidase